MVQAVRNRPVLIRERCFSNGLNGFQRNDSVWDRQERLLHETSCFRGRAKKKVPFLLFFQFLLHCEAILCLSKNRLELKLTKCDAVIALHIGPSGALRLPTNLFSQDMIASLRKAETKIEDHRRQEFELLSLAHDCPSSDLPSPSLAYSLTAFKRPRPAPTRSASTRRGGRAMMMRLLFVIRPTARMVINLARGPVMTSATQTEPSSPRSPSPEPASSSNPGLTTRRTTMQEQPRRGSNMVPGGSLPPTMAGVRAALPSKAGPLSPATTRSRALALY